MNLLQDSIGFGSYNEMASYNSCYFYNSLTLVFFQDFPEWQINL